MKQIYDSPTAVNRAELFTDVIGVLAKENHDLCLLHGYLDFPESISSDIDAISEDPQEVPYIIAKNKVATIVQVLQHEATAFYYVLYREGGVKPTLIALDVSLDYRRNGRVFFKGEEFLQNRLPYKFFQVPTPQLEFAYYLVKKVAKGVLTEAHCQRLSDIYAEDTRGCQEQLLHFFPEIDAGVISQAAANRNWESVNNQMGHFRQALLGKVGRENILKVWVYWLKDLVRRIKRVLYPTGVMVAILGPDGSGKSTVITEVSQNLAPAFRRTHNMHIRPKLGIPANHYHPPTIDPQGEAPRSWLMSTVKLFYYLFDYAVGYLLKVYPKLVYSTLVIFDRYYYDMIADPKRYRYGGYLWLVKLLTPLIPKPDLLIVLDAPAEILQSRKQEVPLAETARQRDAYLQIAQNMSNAYVVDASLPIEEVVTQVETIVLEYMRDRTAKRLRLTYSS
ncbi:MAG TPA: thymidylate kinase-like protein [Cyanobacteria bacterium UBA11149]|nr:thymidylate kinase-like protein [Cyanobacteria bacterium UBA11367]HBE56699.1 thymidylate kinase-like protein [Cyanobacteria bacterium UBA11366]HBK63014.1 thymidylate kinase-like protein [Cyanobacteria bacterium UBA11166]HBR72315.1 thymidylate kinase-like protein [Cyanobacteria bacterium UBA11159]HBS70385.1 thymidylate kinase-like protein [Cyanobacteria bacterium UBA11153]HBW87589.1 thymidylate kinase-like protein [Cyanobacteria bacterium UBA11149]HCA97161.1 thymidylate kinase-like protein 